MLFKERGKIIFTNLNRRREKKVFLHFFFLSILGGKNIFLLYKQKHKNEHYDLPNFKYNSYEITALEHLNLKWHQPMSKK